MRRWRPSATPGGQLIFACMTRDHCLAGTSSPPSTAPAFRSDCRLVAALACSGRPGGGKRALHRRLLQYLLQDKLENCLLGGFFHIFKVKADFPEPAQHPARYLILFKYPNCCSGFSRTSAYPPADKTALHLRASLCFLPVRQAKNTSPIPARHPGLPSDKQIIG